MFLYVCGCVWQFTLCRNVTIAVSGSHSKIMNMNVHVLTKNIPQNRRKLEQTSFDEDNVKRLCRRRHALFRSKCQLFLKQHLHDENRFGHAGSPPPPNGPITVVPDPRLFPSRLRIRLANKQFTMACNGPETFCQSLKLMKEHMLSQSIFQVCGNSTGW